ncbi:unnamed protein product [Clonostachys rosea]|uniref:Uncharacterized protein n=1 Tax=Bionectria ochroleuca TaxID=29856 RepID=A0ABY6UA14_BIOOC|nr:unnamed protein product [Clonostachys rosea]
MADNPVPRDSSAALAVGKIIQRGKELASMSGNAQERISRHAYYVACCILRFALNTPHDQQSKLVEFVLLLSKETVPDVQGGGVLRCEELDEDLWKDVPYVFIVWRDYVHGYLSDQIAESINVSLRQASEGFYALLAQLSELGFCKLNETVSWCYDAVAGIIEFQTGDPDEDSVRLLCLWLIYAPNKLRQDTLLRREDRAGPFKPEFWERWTVLLREQQGRFGDKDTEELINEALATSERVQKSGSPHSS